MGRARVLCVINSLAGGGAERVFASLLDAMAARVPDLDFEIALLDDEPRAYTLPQKMPLIQLDARRSMARSVAALTAHTLRRPPDALFAFLTRANCAAIVAGKLAQRPVVISERTFTSTHLEGRALQKKIVKTLYPVAGHVIAVGQASRADLVRHFGVAPGRVSVIHNPVATENIRREAVAGAPRHARPYVIAIGRLARSKNFTLLIDAFSRANLPHDLLLLGEGPERGALQARIDALGLADRIRLVGRLENPFPLLAGADCLAVSSNVEGFPNVIVEALALGVPVVSTDCDCGPAELLGGDPAKKVRALSWVQYGALTPANDVEALAVGLAGICDEARRTLYSQRGPGRAAMFDVERAAGLYLDVIEKALKTRQPRAPALERAA